MRSLSQLWRDAKDNRDNPVPLERLFLNLLKRRQLPFEYQRVIGYYIVDFFFPDRCLIVELYEAHHRDTVPYDHRRQLYFEALGFQFMIIWENEDPLAAIDAIRQIPARAEWTAKTKQLVTRANKRLYEDRPGKTSVPWIGTIYFNKQS